MEILLYLILPSPTLHGTANHSTFHLPSPLMFWSIEPLWHSGHWLLTMPIVHCVVESGVTPTPPPMPRYMMQVPHPLPPLNWSWFIAIVTMVPVVQEEEDMVLAKFSLKEQAPLASCVSVFWVWDKGRRGRERGEKKKKKKKEFPSRAKNDTTAAPVAASAFFT